MIQKRFVDRLGLGLLDGEFSPDDRGARGAPRAGSFGSTGSAVEAATGGRGVEPGPPHQLEAIAADRSSVGRLRKD